MAIKIKPKAKLISVGKAEVAPTVKVKAMKPSKNAAAANAARQGLPKGSTYLYKNEPKQKVD